MHSRIDFVQIRCAFPFRNGRFYYLIHLAFHKELRVEQVTASGDKITRLAKSTAIAGKVGNITFGADSLIDNNTKTVTKIVSTSPSGPTRAENKIKQFLLQVLEGRSDLFRTNVWFTNIIVRRDEAPSWPPDWSTGPFFPLVDQRVLEKHPVRQRLNASQQTALDHMLSRDPVTIIQGPPGTGKTSVIAAYVQTALDVGYTGIWLVAQSNVAVKNIAEKLLKIDFHDFRLLVSADFKEGWCVCLFLTVD